MSEKNELKRRKYLSVSEKKQKGSMEEFQLPISGKQNTSATQVRCRTSFP